jgi:endoglucanase
MHQYPLTVKLSQLLKITSAAVILTMSFNVVAQINTNAARCQFTTPLPERAFACNMALQRSVNIGNVFDHVKEGVQGPSFQDEFFPLIKKAGFTGVRIPIRWDARASLKAPYEIQPKFFDRIDYVVKLAKEENLAVIIDMHHFVGMTMDPDAELPRFLGVWKQVAEHYKKAPANVMFEVLNEPHDTLNPEKWQKAFNAVLPVIRKSNPSRTIIVGGSEWNSANGLLKLELPSADQNLIATFHFYEPMAVTHQGAEWVSGSTAWLGTTWTGEGNERNVIDSTFDRVAFWAKENKRPILMGEFGVYNKADHSSRIAWTREVRKAAEARGFSWAYWELISSFGILEPRSLEWRADLLATLIDPK